MTKHDEIFKELLTTYFVDFIDLFLPDLAGYLDPRSLIFLSQELLDKELLFTDSDGAHRNVDLVAQARFRDQDALFLAHVEHQAQPEAVSGRRVFFYFSRLHEKHELPVYPIVLFSHDRRRPEPDVYQVSFPDREVLRFQYRVIQLNQLHWRDFLGRPNPAAAALMAKMNISPEDRPRVKLECLRLLATLKLEAARARFLSGFIDTYLRLNAQESLLFDAQADRLLNRSERTKVMELTTSWKEEGREEGWQKGRQEGWQKGQVHVVLRLLRRRCGPLPPSIETMVQGLSAAKVENLADAVLDFSSLTDLERWLQGR